MSGRGDDTAVPVPGRQEPPETQGRTLAQEADHVSGLWAAGLGVAFLAIVALGGLWAWALLPESAAPLSGEHQLEVPEEHGRVERSLLEEAASPVWGGGVEGGRERGGAADTGGYAWVDREAGLVRIPLEEAMELIARESRAP